MLLFCHPDHQRHEEPLIDVINKDIEAGFNLSVTSPVALAGPGIPQMVFNLAYWSAVRLRSTPPRPVSMAWPSISRPSWSVIPPPRSTSSTTLSDDVKRSLRGRAVFRSFSRNWHCHPLRHWKYTAVKAQAKEAGSCDAGAHPASSAEDGSQN